MKKVIKNLPKQLILAVAFLATLGQLSAGLLNNTLNTAGNLTRTAASVPGDVLNSPKNRNGMAMSESRQNYDTDFSEEFMDYNPEM